MWRRFHDDFMPFPAEGTAAVALTAVTVVAFTVSLLVGPMELGLREVVDVLLGRADGQTRTVVLELRLPPAVLAVVVGAALSLAQALAGDPALLLLDEPTSALDLRHQAAVFHRVSRHVVETGALAIAAVHDLHLAARHCDRLMLLREGRLVAQGTPEEVLTAPVLERVYEVPVRVLRAGDGLVVQTVTPTG